MENQQQLEQPLTALNVTVAARARGPVKGYRPREYLTEREIERLARHRRAGTTVATIND